jgi:hypothetical protein
MTYSLSTRSFLHVLEAVDFQCLLLASLTPVLCWSLLIKPVLSYIYIVCILPLLSVGIYVYTICIYSGYKFSYSACKPMSYDDLPILLTTHNSMTSNSYLGVGMDGMARTRYFISRKPIHILVKSQNLAKYPVPSYLSTRESPELTMPKISYLFSSQQSHTSHTSTNPMTYTKINCEFTSCWFALTPKSPVFSLKRTKLTSNRFPSHY